MTNTVARFLLGIVVGFVVGNVGMAVALYSSQVTHKLLTHHVKVVPISNPHKDTLRLNPNAKIDVSQIEDMRGLTTR